MGLRLASKRFASMPRGKAKVREFQRDALRTFGIKNCHRKESWLTSKSTEGAAHAAANHLYWCSAQEVEGAQRNPFIAFEFTSQIKKIRKHRWRSGFCCTES